MTTRRRLACTLLAAALPGLPAAGATSAARPRPQITLPMATLSRYVGTYELARGKKVLIRLDGGQLTAQLPGQAPLPILPETETRFFLKGMDAQLEFGSDAAGAVTHLLLRQDRAERKALRRSATAPPPPAQGRRETAVPVETLAKYPGTYELRPNAVLTVTLEGDRLMAQLTGQPKFPIFPESETLFFYKNVKATLEFLRNRSGATTSVRLRQGRVDHVLPRR
jgi:hypothetical protein